jgi:hypothetical protein
MFACQPERHINTNRGDNKLPRAALADLQSRAVTLQPRWLGRDSASWKETMMDNEIAAKLRELAQEACRLQQHLRRLVESVSLQDPAMARPLEDALQELERLATDAEALATLAEGQ